MENMLFLIFVWFFLFFLYFNYLFDFLNVNYNFVVHVWYSTIQSIYWPDPIQVTVCIVRHCIFLSEIMDALKTLWLHMHVIVKFFFLFSKFKNLKSCWFLFTFLQSVGLNASLYNLLIQAFCSRGKIISAKRLYMKMRSHGLHPDGKTRALMLQHLPEDSTKQFVRKAPYSNYWIFFLIPF